MATATKKRPKPKKKPRGRPVVFAWKDDYYLQAHELARSGMADSNIARALGVRLEAFHGWVARKPALKRALESARSSPSARGQTFLDYVYMTLPADLRALWNEIEALDKPPLTTAEQRKKAAWQREIYPDAVDALFQRCGVDRARQSLWIHALVAANFDATEACRKINVSRSTVNRWRSDPQFEALIQQIEHYKDDFAESCLFQAMSRGDTAAIIFANKCRNEKYNPKKKVEHSGAQLLQAVDLNKLLDQLPMEVRLQALKALEAPKEVVDARSNESEPVAVDLPQ